MRAYLTITLFALLCFPILSRAQNTTTVRGAVTDKNTLDPLIGANIKITLSDGSVKGSTTDIDGNYVVENVPVERLQIECSYLGYKTQIQTRETQSSRVLILDFELEEGVELSEVLVVATQTFESVNQFTDGMVSLTPEVMRSVSATGNDPGRTLVSFPGVQPSRDTRSDIVVRANSSVGMSWRLEGIDIPNPNHFARRGTSGGGITIFSISMLDRSDFLTGAFPAEYGNAFSGVFDGRFRKGNDQNREYTFRAGILGLDFSTEGPFKKGKNSYLVNYRYSTLGILNSLGIHLVGERVDNTFQDLSFNLNFKGKDNGSNLNFWGIGGLSTEIQNTVEPQSEWMSFSDQTYYEFTTNMGAAGLKYTKNLGSGYLQLSGAIMGQQVVVQDDTVSTEGVHTLINREDFVNGRYSFSGFYNFSTNADLTFKTGFFASNLFYDLQHDSLRLTDFQEQQIMDVQGNTVLLQPYFQMKWTASPTVTINAGLHSMFLTLNNTYSIEPRASVILKPGNGKNKFSLSYGLHSRMVPIGSYFTQALDPGSETLPNLELELIKSHHFIGAFTHNFSSILRLRAEAYYQYLFDVPVGVDESLNYWTLNDIQGYSTQELVSNGIGRNMGIDLIFQQSPSDKGIFFIATASLFNSQFKMSEESEDWFNTRYNSNFSGSFSFGKDWQLKEGNRLEVGFRAIYNGGMRITPLRANTPTDNQYFPPLDFARPFEDQIQAYFRPDARVAYRHNKKTSWILALDIQNIIARRNIDGLNRLFDPELNVWVDRLQSGLTPILSFQIDL